MADDDAERAGAVARILAGDPGLTVLRMTAGVSLTEAVAAHAPDIVLVDMARPDRDALDGIRLMASLTPRPVVLFVDEDDPYVNPLGAKGIGEIAIVGMAPAIANAVFDATGVRIRKTPPSVPRFARMKPLIARSTLNR